MGNKYGLISKKDGETLEKVIDLICGNKNREVPVCITEIGIFNGLTSLGLYEYVKSKGFNCEYIGIDSEKDKPVFPPKWMYMLRGNSTEVFYKIYNHSQDLVFVDGNHSYIGVISDYFAYKNKVKVGGYMAFHDCGKHIALYKDFQHGNKDDLHAYICSRLAINELINCGAMRDWELVFDEADPNDEAGGIMVFKRLA